MMHALRTSLLAAGLTCALSGCVDAWLGHPGQPDQTPTSASWQFSDAARTLVDDTVASLPPIVVDHAAYVRRPTGASSLLDGLRQRIWADAVNVKTKPSRWQAPYITRLEEQVRHVPHPVQLVALTHTLPTHPASSPWPDAWRLVSSAAEHSDRWVHGLMLLGTGPQADTVWLDLTAIEDHAPALALADSLARAGRTVLLVGCMRGSEDQLMACIRTLRSAPANARLFLLIDGLGNPLTAPGLLNIALQQIDLFGRMRYASAYPYPAINTHVSLDRLVWADLLAADEVAPLREIYAHNPWLFDLVLKRRLKLPGTSLGFTADVFGPLPAAPAPAG
ncbi:MAG: hypothetical protein VX549_12240 [Pseudomonadota bacterium]|nr:hypothetical protein [Pseudomonadota bacterium]